MKKDCGQDPASLQAIIRAQFHERKARGKKYQGRVLFDSPFRLPQVNGVGVIRKG